MIPHKLQLKNFLSYGATIQSVDFAPYPLICLSGKNGHGKSALLDAMTWALWGQARKVFGPVRADHGLMRLGQTQMLVIFDFEFGGTLYRIRREYTEQYGKSTVNLEFGIIDSATGSFIPLTDKTVRTTQEKIEQVMRLDFESFVNSAFLRQGGSNEFSKKTAKERKHILATILGLDQYEVIKRLALDKIKDAQIKRYALATLQEKRRTDLLAEQELCDKLAQLHATVTELALHETTWHAEQTALMHEHVVYQEEQKKHDQLIFQKQQIEQQILNQTEQLRISVHAWRTINKKQQALHHAEILEQEKKRLIAEINRHQHLFQHSLELKEQLLHLTHELHTLEQQDKETQARLNQTNVLELERMTTHHSTHKKAIIQIQEQIDKYTQEQTALTAEIEATGTTQSCITISSPEVIHIEQQLEKRKASYHHFVSLGNIISAELQSIAQKKKMVHDENNPSCPLCEQNLSASRRRLLKSNFESHEHFLHHRLQRLKAIIPTLKETLIAQHAHLTEYKKQLHQHDLFTLKIQELTHAQEKIAHYIRQAMQQSRLHTQEIDTLTEKINTLTLAIAQQATVSGLTDNQEYQTLVHKKDAIVLQIKTHAYNAQSYAAAQNQLKIIECQLNDYETIKKAVAQQEQRKQDIHTICMALRTIKKQIIALETETALYNNVRTKQIMLEEKTKKHAEIVKEIQNKKELLLQERGGIESQQKQIEKIRVEYETEQKTLMHLDDCINDYQTIATATGKDGIQALLIEDAIPEIEQEANQLLAQLTNNQAQIFIESLRDLKRGGTKETLDIKISDSAGIRPYEMFSGGEAFRIDFALRIAISKLLARRAGTALQTLIIDEGFGSQDEEGLNHIMEALHKIQTNFSKIIIVSHLASMKDQFPVHFVVEKKVQGSVVSVMEQG